VTEKIVAVLKRMQCPLVLEPHQIQGLDFVHIFPAVQWLLREALEMKENWKSLIESTAASQFSSFFGQKEVWPLPEGESTGARPDASARTDGAAR
jgi:CCDC93, coiled-coil domain